MSFWAKLTEFLLNVPPWATVFPNEGGVFLRGGKYKETLTAGFYIKWPIYDVVQKLNVTTQPINLPNQSIITKDDHTVAASGAIEYSIGDARKAILCVLNFDVSLQNLAMGTIAHYLNRKNYADCMDISGIEREVLGVLEKRVESWGLCITDFLITDLAEHKVFRVMSKDTPLAFIPTEEE